jgi:hypothetical protein
VANRNPVPTGQPETIRVRVWGQPWAIFQTDRHPLGALRRTSPELRSDPSRHRTNVCADYGSVPERFRVLVVAVRCV